MLADNYYFHVRHLQMLVKSVDKRILQRINYYWLKSIECGKNNRDLTINTDHKITEADEFIKRFGGYNRYHKCRKGFDKE